MKLQSILGAATASVALIKGATTATFLIGFMYLVDCRISGRGSQDVDRCWMTALPIMGIGGIGRGAFEVGLQTPTPPSKKEEERTGIFGGGGPRRG